MTQEVICKKRRCYEAGSIRSELDEVYGSSNIADQIEYGLLFNQIND